MRINQWDDWYSIEAQAREADAQLDAGLRPDAVPVQLWIPEHYVGVFASEITTLDLDLRRGAVLLPSRMFSPRMFPFAPILNLPEPINSLDGRLELVSARREDSILADLTAVGAMVGLLTDVPTLFFMIRAATRRLPFRIRFERDRVQDASDTVMEPIEGHFSDRQAHLIEAGRLARRVRIDHPSGVSVIVEEYE